MFDADRGQYSTLFDNVVASVSVIVPSHRFKNQKKTKKAATIVKNCALEISRALGYNEELA